MLWRQPHTQANKLGYSIDRSDRIINFVTNLEESLTGFVVS